MLAVIIIAFVWYFVWRSVWESIRLRTDGNIGPKLCRSILCSCIQRSTGI